MEPRLNETALAEAHTSASVRGTDAKPSALFCVASFLLI